MSRDTPRHVQRLLDEHHRRMRPDEKAEALAEAWSVALALQAGALRAERPDLGEDEIEDVLAARRLGQELFARAAEARARAATG